MKLRTVILSILLSTLTVSIVSYYIITKGTIAQTAEEKVFDPVCDMEINKNTAVTSEYKGTTYYFCSKTCKANFEKEPDKFITK